MIRLTGSEVAAMTDKSFARLCKRQNRITQEHKRTMTETVSRNNERYHRNPKSLTIARDAFDSPEAVLVAHLPSLDSEPSTLLPFLPTIINVFVDPAVWLESFVPSAEQIAGLTLSPNVDYTLTLKRELLALWTAEFDSFLHLPLGEMLRRVPYLFQKRADTARTLTETWLPVVLKLTQDRVFKASETLKSLSHTPKRKKRKAAPVPLSPAKSLAGEFDRMHLMISERAAVMRKQNAQFNKFSRDMKKIREFVSVKPSERTPEQVLTKEQKQKLRAMRVRKHVTSVSFVAMAVALEHCVSQFCETMRVRGPGIEEIASRLQDPAKPFLALKLLNQISADLKLKHTNANNRDRLCMSLSLKPARKDEEEEQEEEEEVDEEARRQAKRATKKQLLEIRHGLVRLELALSLRQFVRTACETFIRGDAFRSPAMTTVFSSCLVALDRLVDQEMPIVLFVSDPSSKIANMKERHLVWMQSNATIKNGIQTAGSHALSEAIDAKLSMRPPSFSSVTFVDFLSEVLSSDSLFKKIPLIHAFTKLKPLPGQHRMFRNVIRPYMYAEPMFRSLIIDALTSAILSCSPPDHVGWRLVLMAQWRQAKQSLHQDSPASWRFFDMIVYHASKFTEFALRCYLCDRIEKDSLMMAKANSQFDFETFARISVGALTDCMKQLLDRDRFTRLVRQATVLWPTQAELIATTISKKVETGKEQFSEKQAAVAAGDGDAVFQPIDDFSELETELREILKLEEPPNSEPAVKKVKVKQEPESPEESATRKKKEKKEATTKQNRQEHAIKQKAMFDAARENLATLAGCASAKELIAQLVEVDTTIASEAHKEMLEFGCVKPTQTLSQVVRSIGKNSRPKKNKQASNQKAKRVLKRDDLYNIQYGMTERQFDLLFRTVNAMDTNDPLPELALIMVIPAIVEADEQPRIERETVLHCCAAIATFVRERLTDGCKPYMLKIREDTPLVYAIVFVFASMWKFHTQLRVVELPERVRRAQINAVRHKANLSLLSSEESLEHALDGVGDGQINVFFCPICMLIASFVRDYTSARSVTGDSGESERDERVCFII